MSTAFSVNPTDSNTVLITYCPEDAVHCENKALQVDLHKAKGFFVDDLYPHKDGLMQVIVLKRDNDLKEHVDSLENSMTVEYEVIKTEDGVEIQYNPFASNIAKRNCLK